MFLIDVLICYTTKVYKSTVCLLQKYDKSQTKGTTKVRLKSDMSKVRLKSDMSSTKVRLKYVPYESQTKVSLKVSLNVRT